MKIKKNDYEHKASSIIKISYMPSIDSIIKISYMPSISMKIKILITKNINPTGMKSDHISTTGQYPLESIIELIKTNAKKGEKYDKHDKYDLKLIKYMFYKMNIDYIEL